MLAEGVSTHSDDGLNEVINADRTNKLEGLICVGLEGVEVIDF